MEGLRNIYSGCAAAGRLVFVLGEFLFYVGCEFADAVDDDSHPGLREDALISLDGDGGVIGIPGCADCSGAECGCEGHDVGADGLFVVGVGDEVSDKGVTEAWPRS